MILRQPAFWVLVLSSAAAIVLLGRERNPPIDPLPWDDDQILAAVCEAYAELETNPLPATTAIASALWPSGFHAETGDEIALSWPPLAEGEQLRTWDRLLGITQNLETIQCPNG